MKKQSKRPIIDTDRIKAAYQTMLDYKAGKLALDRRIIANEAWFKARCSAAQAATDSLSQSSAWLFNAIINKHADAMDSYPEPNVLPREDSDTPDAERLSQILPVILEQQNFEQTYSDVWWYKLKTGTGVYGVFWNSSLEGGLGDVDIRQMDILNLFWEPGIKSIEDSSNLFYAQAVDRDALLAAYPQMAEHLHTTDNMLEAYQLEDGGYDPNKVLVIDWYYKRTVNGRQALHYCKFAGDCLLFASENEERFRQRGFYDHGRYPVVFDTMFVAEGSPAGFGYVDVMKGCQMSIDRLNAAIMRNAVLSESPRWFISDAAGINEEEYADWSRPFVHTTGRIDDQTVKQVEVDGISQAALQLLQFKVDELKENAGNRDFTQGGTALGVTAASAIAMLQEAGSKLARDMIKSSFRAYASICYLMVELIRQFYTEPRTFRITGPNGSSFVTYSNSGLQCKQDALLPGTAFGGRRPVFDITIVPQRQSPYQKAQQNELAKELFSLGMLNPDRKAEAIAAIRMMDFDGKQQVLAGLMKADKQTANTNNGE